MNGPEFEREVRAVARALWNLLPGEGAAERINGDEIDCVCRTEELVHLIECTTKRSMEKFRTQVLKLKNAKGYLEGMGETVKLRIVTLHEPTPDQRTNARGSGITALSLQEFRRGLLDSRQYLDARWNYRFGSASNPEDGSHRLPEEEYVEQSLLLADSAVSYSVSDICRHLQDGKVIILVGPFGAGKSLTAREVFKYFRAEYHRGRNERTPIVINLRDHWGQSDIDEILRRHATRVGFGNPAQLVRAWNAGQLLPLLDGVDELASPVMAMGKDAIRRSREEALKVVQAFIHDIVGRTGALLTCRDQYFDSIEEARKLMRLPSDAMFVSIGEFSESQATEYLKRRGVTSVLPTWIPRKPLLLGYLASRGLLEHIAALSGDTGTAFAWDSFLDRICEREADLSSDIDSVAVRQLLEDLATRVRSLPSGSGPLYDADLASAYRAITGYEPSESARTLLQRLPGLTARDQEIGARSFIDDEMMDALQAGAVARFIVTPFVAPNITDNVKHPLKAFGCSMAGHLANKQGAQPAQYGVAAAEATQRWNESTLALDSILAGANALDGVTVNANGLTITDGLADEIDMGESSIANLKLSNCLINRINFDSSVSSISFDACQIVRIEGIADNRALPTVFSSCDIQEFDNRHTNTAIIGSEISDPLKVLMVIIRKLFLQRGSGRAESALYRGIGEQLRGYVSPVLDVLVSEGVAYSHPANRQTIWHGNRVHRVRMLKILEGPMNASDPLVKTISEIDRP